VETWFGDKEQTNRHRILIDADQYMQRNDPVTLSNVNVYAAVPTAVEAASTPGVGGYLTSPC